VTSALDSLSGVNTIVKQDILGKPVGNASILAYGDNGISCDFPCMLCLTITMLS